MSLPLLKSTIKKNIVLWIIFLFVLLMYSTVMISMFRPDSLDALNAMFEVLPPDMMKALGFSGAFHDLAGYLASWLYGLIMTAFPLVYCIILGNRLVAKTVDSGSIACLLSTPNSRTKIILTKGIFAIGSMGVMQMAAFAINLMITKIMFPHEFLDVTIFLKLNITVMLVNITAMAITFFFSCLFNETSLSLGFGAGVPITFLLINMLGNASENADTWKKFSIYGWYDPVGIANGDEIFVVCLVYIGIVLILLCASLVIFKKKRLPV